MPKNKNDDKKKERTLFDQYLDLLEYKTNQGNLLDDGTMLLTKYDELIKSVNSAKQDVRKAANNTILAHRRLRLQLKSAQKLLTFIIKLSTTMQKNRQTNNKTKTMVYGLNNENDILDDDQDCSDEKFDIKSKIEED